jgi:hypothetical protein
VCSANATCPGRPSLYGTTREFLDYFGLKSLDELPTLAELRDLDEINRELDLGDPDGLVAAANPRIGEAGEAGDEPGPEPDREQPLDTQEPWREAMEPDVADAETVARADDDGGPEMASPREHDAATTIPTGRRRDTGGSDMSLRCRTARAPAEAPGQRGIRARDASSSS